MTGAHPYRDMLGGNAALRQHLGQPRTRRDFYPLHAEHEILFRNVIGEDSFHKSAKSLRGNGNNDHFRMLYRLFEIARQMNPLVQRHVFVLSRRFEYLVGIIPFRSPRIYVVAFITQIPRDKRTPSSAAQNRYFHKSTPKA